VGVEDEDEFETDRGGGRGGGIFDLVSDAAVLSAGGVGGRFLLDIDLACFKGSGTCDERIGP